MTWNLHHHHLIKSSVRKLSLVYQQQRIIKLAKISSNLYYIGIIELIQLIEIFTIKIISKSNEPTVCLSFHNLIDNQLNNLLQKLFTVYWFILIVQDYKWSVNVSRITKLRLIVSVDYSLDYNQQFDYDDKLFFGNIFVYQGFFFII